MSEFKVGQKVVLSESAKTEWWASKSHYQTAGVVTEVETDEVHADFSGHIGLFTEDELIPAIPAMSIVSIKRSTQKTGLKVYGKVQGESGKAYNFAYIRRPNFRGWICSCDNFFFEMFKKSRNCKHLKFVRTEVGRFGSKVPKNKVTQSVPVFNHRGARESLSE